MLFVIVSRFHDIGSSHDINFKGLGYISNCKLHSRSRMDQTAHGNKAICRHFSNARPGKPSLNVRKQPCCEKISISIYTGINIGRPWYFACRVGEASMPGPSGFADSLSEAEAALLIQDLFGEQSGDESTGSRVSCFNNRGSAGNGAGAAPEECHDKGLYERDVSPYGLTPDEVQAALPRPVKEFSIISVNIGSYELHKDVAMNWPHTVKCFHETQLDKGMIRYACKEALFSNQHILACLLYTSDAADE